MKDKFKEILKNKYNNILENISMFLSKIIKTTRNIKLHSRVYRIKQLFTILPRNRQAFWHRQHVRRKKTHRRLNQERLPKL